MAAYKKVQRKVNKEVKNIIKKNPVLIVSVLICIVVGLVAGFALCNFVLCKNDEFTIYKNGSVYDGKVIAVESGQSYDLLANMDYSVVGCGADLSSHVQYYVMYLENEDSELEAVSSTTFSQDGTYYVIYYLAYDGADFLAGLGAYRYENVKLRVTVQIGGNDNG